MVAYLTVLQKVLAIKAYRPTFDNKKRTNYLHSIIIPSCRKESMYKDEEAREEKVKPMTLAEKAALAKKNLRVVGGHKIALAPEMMYLNDRIAKDEVRRCNFQESKYNLTRFMNTLLQTKRLYIAILVSYFIDVQTIPKTEVEILWWVKKHIGVMRKESHLYGKIIGLNIFLSYKLTSFQNKKYKLRRFKGQKLHQYL